jgi:hypothetical protein
MDTDMDELSVRVHIPHGEDIEAIPPPAQHAAKSYAAGAIFT